MSANSSSKHPTSPDISDASRRASSAAPKSGLKVAVLCGGPSLERGISLNSARSISDHLSDEDIEIVPIYFDQGTQPYQISRAQLYSNTPSDFDFKLQQNARQLSPEQLRSALTSVDIVFPAIHGKFGEDGELQTLLESFGCPFVGSPAAACRRAFDKIKVAELIAKNGFHTIPQLELRAEHLKDTSQIEAFFRTHALTRAVVKPARGGSSIAVTSVANPHQAIQAARKIFEQRVDERAVLEPFCQGTEFTVVILENKDQQPVALLPIEVSMDYGNDQIFDYRRKYLATRQVSYHCPARFEQSVLAEIRSLASKLFTLLGMKDFARFDGWVLNDGRIYFPDFNPISGMEQNSFLFIQASQLGMSHRDVLRYVLSCSCARQGVAVPDSIASASIQKAERERAPVSVIFGGDSAERQVSVMSGTNVWLKLKRSQRYQPTPFLLDTKRNVWELPYCLALYHTVEEIAELCRETDAREVRVRPFREKILQELAAPAHFFSESHFTPRALSLEQLAKESSLVFIALHGGIGENGELQKLLESHRTRYTGSGPAASALCMDKYLTGEALADLAGEGITSARKVLATPEELAKNDSNATFARLSTDLGQPQLIVKPVGDGCSAGVAKLCCATDLAQYVRAVESGDERIPAGTLSDQETIIEMPPTRPERLLFEPFIETLRIRAEGKLLSWPKDGPHWVEITVAVRGSGATLHAMSPSITVASASVLSLEEKFQGGTGINITPPPEELVSRAVCERVQQRITKVAKTLGISGFARIDAFMNIDTGDVIIIEANTVPGLTPSTVLYHQGLAEQPPLYPRELLESFLDTAMTNFRAYA